MRFEDAYESWTEKRLTQIDATQLLGVCPRTFRRAPVDEVMRLVDRYRKRRERTPWLGVMRHQDGRQQQGCGAVLGPDSDHVGPRAC